jgi:hypothetical protein
MKTLIPVVCFTCLALTMASAQDPVKADPAHYKVLLDKPNVRVLDVVLKKGEKTPMAFAFQHRIKEISRRCGPQRALLLCDHRRLG